MSRYTVYKTRRHAVLALMEHAVVLLYNSEHSLTVVEDTSQAVPHVMVVVREVNNPSAIVDISYSAISSIGQSTCLIGEGCWVRLPDGGPWACSSVVERKWGTLPQTITEEFTLLPRVQLQNKDKPT